MKPLTVTSALRARWKNINAKRKAADKPPLNFPLWVKVRNRIAAVPESYNQGYWKQKSSVAPCGTQACLAGEALICSERSAKQGLALLWRTRRNTIAGRASALLGLDRNTSEDQIFTSWIDGEWPEPFATQFAEAEPGMEEAKVAVRYLTHVIRTGQVVE